jgi:choline-sulfatase
MTYPKMNRTCTAIVLCLLVAAGCSRAPEQAQAPLQPSQPVRTPKNINVLLMTIDTLRADYVACYGRKPVATPNIDALASRGVRFAQAIAQVPLTAPSHASILTGTYPHVHNVRDMGGFILEKSVPTLATVLGGAGWNTAAFIGAAVLSHHYGMDRGFGVYSDSMKDEASLKKLPGIVAELRGEVVAHRAIEWLQKADRSKPFFIWTHFYDPHFPYDSPEPYKSRYPKDPYGGEVAYADAQVGKVLKSVKDLGMENNTLVILMADHGESLGEHGEFTHGVFLYDSTVHVPMIVAGPEVPAGRVVPQQVRSIDVMPTVADFAGVSSGDKVQGVSLKSAIVEGQRPGGTYCYMETFYPKTQMGWSELRGMRTSEFKMISAPKPELYRLTDDPAESRNVIDKLTADADRLQKQIFQLVGSPKSQAPLVRSTVDDERRKELEALGYVGSGRRVITTDMSGTDPKDRIDILAILEKASDHMNHDRWQPAAAILEKARAEDKSNVLIYKHLQICYEQLHQLDKLEQVGLRALEAGIEDDEILANISEIYIRRNNLPRAIEFMERAARINPSNLQNMENLATAFLQVGQTADAERTLEAILVQNPKDAAAHNVYGNLEIQRGRMVEAKQHFERSVEYDPDKAEPYVNLGLIAQNSGDREAAIAYYRSFLQKADKDKYREYIPKVRAALADLGAN